MPDASDHIIYPTDPDEKDRLARHIDRHKYSDKHLTLPCPVCGETTPHALAKLVEQGKFRYAIQCSKCGAVATVASSGTPQA